MPAGQVYRLTRAQRQQQRQFDPNLTALQLTDETALNTVPWRQTTASYLRYRGRPPQAQWPVLSRDVNPLQSTDQPLIDLEPWAPPTATYQRYRGRPQQAQWPTYSRLDATGLELVDETVLNTVPEYVAPWSRPPLHAQWRQYFPIGLPPVGGLPDQDVNLVLVSARMWRPPSRASYQQAVVTDPSALELVDFDINLVPVSARMWRPPSATQRRQFTPTDPSGLELADADQTLTFAPWSTGSAIYAIRKSRASWQQAVYFDLGGLGLQLTDQDITLCPVSAVPPRGRTSQGAQWKVQFFTDPLILNPAAPDQDVNLLPVSARLWRPPSRAPSQQAKYFDLGGLGLQLTDQDVRLVPVSSPSSTFLRYRGRQVGYVRVFYPTTDAPPTGPTLVPPLFTLFATDGSMLTSAVDVGIRAVVTSDDGRRTTIFLSTGLMITLKTNP